MAIHGLVLAAAAALAGGAAAQEGRTIHVADRCSLYGAGFVDIGDGSCARVVRQYTDAGSQHVRVDLGRSMSDGTAKAAMRSEGMLPGAADAQHLRVPGGFYAPR